MNAPISSRFAALQGQRPEAIDTPALVIDADAVNRNMQRMAEFAAKHQIRLRPHAKMHKSAELARLQMQAGAVGVCVQNYEIGRASVGKECRSRWSPYH